MADPDLHMGKGGGGNGHLDPDMRWGAGFQKTCFGSSGLSLV